MHLSLAFSYESAFAALVGGLGIGIFATIYAHTNRSAMPSATPHAHVQPAMLVTSAIASALLASQFFEANVEAAINLSGCAAPRIQTVALRSLAEHGLRRAREATGQETPQL